MTESEKNKLLCGVGGTLMAVGFLLFISNASAIRGFVGMGLMALGGFLVTVGNGAMAGSGFTHRPENAGRGSGGWSRGEESTGQHSIRREETRDHFVCADDDFHGSTTFDGCSGGGGSSHESGDDDGC